MNTPEIMFPKLNISIQSFDRELVNIFGLSIYWYGLIVFLGIAAGVVIVLYNAKRLGQNPETYIDFAYIVVPICILGARAYYVIFAWDTYKDNLLHIFAFREGGLAIYGAVIAGFITAIIYTHRKKLNFFLLADTAIVGLIIGQAVGRWGNFINREAFGGYTNSLFSMRYLLSTVDSGNITQEIYNNLVTYNGAQYIQVHPTFLYESLWNFALLIFLMLYTKHKKFDGEIMAYYLLFYGIGRFWIEGLRTDQLMLFGTGLAVSQVLSAAIAIFAVIFIIYKLKFGKKNPLNN